MTPTEEERIKKAFSKALVESSYEHSSDLNPYEMFKLGVKFQKYRENKYVQAYEEGFDDAMKGYGVYKD